MITADVPKDIRTKRLKEILLGKHNISYCLNCLSKHFFCLLQCWRQQYSRRMKINIIRLIAILRSLYRNTQNVLYNKLHNVHTDTRESVELLI